MGLELQTLSGVFPRGVRDLGGADMDLGFTKHPCYLGLLGACDLAAGGEEIHAIGEIRWTKHQDA